MKIPELSKFRKLLLDVEYYQNRLSKLQAAMMQSKIDAADIITEEDRLVFCGEAKQLESIYIDALKCSKRELLRIENYIASVSDPYIKQIMDLRFVQGLSWQQCALRISPRISADSIFMMCKRYIEKHPE
ncbi:MAG: hypothetical protein IJL52_08220 [Clostridia bacterium]|nr:hypothetical protein [Clostridia bacterium]